MASTTFIPVPGLDGILARSALMHAEMEKTRYGHRGRCQGARAEGHAAPPRKHRGGAAIQDGGWVAIASAGTPYAPYVEFGTEDTPAQPFMRPALDAGVSGAGSLARRPHQGPLPDVASRHPDRIARHREPGRQRAQRLRVRPRACWAMTRPRSPQSSRRSRTACSSRSRSTEASHGSPAGCSQPVSASKPGDHHEATPAASASERTGSCRRSADHLPTDEGS